MRTAVDQQWRRIEAWLKANAPVTYAELRPPARAHTIAVAESQMGLRFPDSLRASLLRHNGSRSRSSGLLGWRTLGVREIRDTWRTLCRAHSLGGRPSGPAGLWNPATILVAGSVLDFDPARAEASGLAVDAATGDVAQGGLMAGPEERWTSYYALLKATAAALETGRPVAGRRPVVTAGRLHWAGPSRRTG
ncbi:SMI1/KNR4 family protein [Sphaerisporangium fuscum]|uniref:SMI1/KNR4 family protein n=1 Tax=Sphaerisporangium fuscum TaxID=2835868 RepID=UPI001BDC4AB7|nr:SMI1/KNR4 family protein [Sphaerisporangium fuscum]